MRRGTSVRPAVRASNRHENNARRNRRTAILQRHHRHPSSQVQAVCRQGGVESVRERSSHSLCTVAVGRYWHRRDGRGGRGKGRGRGRTRPWPWGSRRGVSPPSRWSRGPAGPKAIVDSRGCYTSCCGCTPASPGGDSVRRRLSRRERRGARRGRGRRGMARGLNRISPLSRTCLLYTSPSPRD